MNLRGQGQDIFRVSSGHYDLCTEIRVAGVWSFSWRKKNEFYPVGDWEIIMKETRPMPGLVFCRKIGGGSEKENLPEVEA